jgi:hypothetical protein
MRPSPSIIGKQFGLLTVISAGKPNCRISSSRSYRYWKCHCDCGSTLNVREDCLTKRGQKSCGCLRENRRKIRPKNHGMSSTNEYRIWSDIKTRTTNSRHRSSMHYKHRGITMCKRWSESFMAFYRDMGPRPSPSHTVERLNNDKGYSPSNCTWATMDEQAKNKRNNVLLTIGSETHCVAEWSRISGTPKTTIFARINRGWPPEDAVFRAPRDCPAT